MKIKPETELSPTKPSETPPGSSGCANRVLFVWDNFGAYHRDRLEAVATRSTKALFVGAVEISKSSSIYEWDRPVPVPSVVWTTLFEKPWHTVSTLTRIFALVSACVKARADANFLCHYERPETFITAVILRTLRRRVFIMNDSKFDDKPRFVLFELLKYVLHLPYTGALVSGRRAKEYVEFLGIPSRAIALGYDTVSFERLQRLAANESRLSFQERHLTIIARLVPKKNLLHALRVYARYCELAGDASRGLVICGSGPCEPQLKAYVAESGLNVSFKGFADQTAVADTLRNSLALLLLSKEEQWGLVTNEALALGVPLVVSDQVGARDEIVRTNINGFVVERDNIEGTARLLLDISKNEEMWMRLAANTSLFAEQADIGAFVRGVQALTGYGEKDTCFLEV